MKANWKPISQDTPGITQYKRSHPRARAEIHRQDNKLSAEMKTGPFGLGTHVGACFMDTGLSDEAVLTRLDEVAHPPRFQDWHEVKDQSAAGVTHYQGHEGRKKVDAYITRSQDEAQVVAQSGHFGIHIEGTYFAPTPSDREILQRISQSN